MPFTKSGRCDNRELGSVVAVVDVVIDGKSDGLHNKDYQVIQLLTIGNRHLTSWMEAQSVESWAIEMEGEPMMLLTSMVLL